MTLHAILVLPAFALLLASLGWAQDRRTRAAAVGVYAIATVAVLAVSLAGE